MWAHQPGSHRRNFFFLHLRYLSREVSGCPCPSRDVYVEFSLLANEYRFQQLGSNSKPVRRNSRVRTEPPADLLVLYPPENTTFYVERARKSACACCARKVFELKHLNTFSLPPSPPLVPCSFPFPLFSPLSHIHKIVGRRRQLQELLHDAWCGGAHGNSRCSAGMAG